MAIDSTAKKLSLMSMSQVWQSALPISSDGLDQADKQHLLWGYAGVLWEAAADAVVQTIDLLGSIVRTVNLTGTITRTANLTGGITRTVNLTGVVRS